MAFKKEKRKRRKKLAFIHFFYLMRASLPHSTTMLSCFHSAPTSGKLGRWKVDFIQVPQKAHKYVCLKDVKTVFSKAKIKADAQGAFCTPFFLLILTCSRISQISSSLWLKLLSLIKVSWRMYERPHVPRRLCLCHTILSWIPLPIDDCCKSWGQGNLLRFAL